MAHDVFGHDARNDEIQKIIAAAGFGAAAGHLESAERMAADDGAGAGAIDVNIAGDDLALARSILAGLREKNPAVRAKSVPFATAMASSRSRTLMTLRTGPKISSHAMREFGRTLVKMVGGTKNPFAGTSPF